MRSRRFVLDSVSRKSRFVFLGFSYPNRLDVAMVTTNAARPGNMRSRLDVRIDRLDFTFRRRDLEPHVHGFVVAALDLDLERRVGIVLVVLVVVLRCVGIFMRTTANLELFVAFTTRAPTRTLRRFFCASVRRTQCGDEHDHRGDEPVPRRTL